MKSAKDRSVAAARAHFEGLFLNTDDSEVLWLCSVMLLSEVLVLNSDLLGVEQRGCRICTPSFSRWIPCPQIELTVFLHRGDPAGSREAAWSHSVDQKSLRQLIFHRTWQRNRSARFEAVNAIANLV